MIVAVNPSTRKHITVGHERMAAMALAEQHLRPAFALAEQD
jgi:hypothetical protein